ncbi:MAG: polyketide synthase, partial [bacterium]|nr:polyketide synthase [bacterium]
VEKERFTEALNKLMDRHETLRTSFRLINGEPVQRVHREVELETEYRERERKSGCVDFIRPFDLSRAPLLRLGLIKMEEDRHILMFDMHHIISDGVSIAIFLKEFMDLYAAKNPGPLLLQYKDFAQWQHRRLASGKFEKQEIYWLERFSHEPPVLNMPTDFPRPAVQDFAGDSLQFS